MTENCGSCEALAKQLVETEIKLAKAEKERDDLKKRLTAAGEFATVTARAASRKMRTGDIGRAEYGFAHAQLDFGNVVLKHLGLKEVALKKRLKGILGFGQGLFEGLFGGS